MIDTADQPGGRVGPITVGDRAMARSRSPPTAARLRRQLPIEDDVSVIDTPTNLSTGTTITVGNVPDAVAIVPDQPPVASFSDPSRPPRRSGHLRRLGLQRPRRLDRQLCLGLRRRQRRRSTAAQSRATPIAQARHLQGDPDGDRQRGLLDRADLHRPDRLLQRIGAGEPDPDGEGRLPRGPRQVPEGRQAEGCKFKLQAITKKRKGKAESAVAKAKVKAGQVGDRLAEAKERSGRSSPPPRRSWSRRR